MLEVSSKTKFTHILKTKLCIPAPYKEFSSEAIVSKLLLFVLGTTTRRTTNGELESTIFYFHVYLG